MKSKTILIIIAILLVVVAGALFVENRKNHNLKETEPVQNEINTQNETQPDVVARFDCPNGAFIDAKFFNQEPNNSVDITLSDGRNYKLPQAISASGARYANADESFVFWNKGDMAFTMENENIVLNECYTKSQDENANSNTSTNTNIVGGDKDAHGCIGSAGYSWCAVKNKCLRIWEEKCEATNSSKIILDANNKKTSCENNGGVWYTDNNTCEINSLSETSCIAKGGEFNQCASACRHDPKAEVCTMQCILTCTFK